MYTIKLYKLCTENRQNKQANKQELSKIPDRVKNVSLVVELVVHMYGIRLDHLCIFVDVYVHIYANCEKAVVISPLSGWA